MFTCAVFLSPKCILVTMSSVAAASEPEVSLIHWATPLLMVNIEIQPVEVQPDEPGKRHSYTREKK